MPISLRIRPSLNDVKRNYVVLAAAVNTGIAAVCDFVCELQGMKHRHHNLRSSDNTERHHHSHVPPIFMLLSPPVIGTSRHTILITLSKTVQQTSSSNCAQAERRRPRVNTTALTNAADRSWTKTNRIASSLWRCMELCVYVETSSSFQNATKWKRSTARLRPPGGQTGSTP